MLPEVGELVFSFVVGYMGALEFLYVVRHLYHWGFQHNPEMRDYKSEAESLRKLQDQLKNAIADAKEREELGLKAMKDGVEYKDGFRIDEDRKKIDELKEQVKIQEKRTERQREIEEELQRQRKIEEETRKQLKQAEEELRRVEEEKAKEKRKAEEEHRKAEEAKRKAEEDKRKAEVEEKERKQREEEENKRKILEDEKKREEEQRLQEEQAENERKQLKAEKEREEKQRLQEIEAEKKKQEDEKKENELKLLQAEKEMEEKQKLQEIEEAEKKKQEQKRREEEERKANELKLLQAEKEMEEKQRLQEIEVERKKQEEQQRLQEEEAKENELRLYQAEKEREEMQRQQEIEDEKVVQKLLQAEREREREERENTERLIAAEKEAIQKQREQEENDENVRNLLKAERELELKKQEMEEEAANLQRLIEAEKEMEERQRKVDEEALLKLKNAQEEIELKQAFDAEADEEAFVKKESDNAEQSVTPTQTVKTQYGQTVSESLKPKTLLFPEVSEESSAEPVSSMQSSFSTQQSSEAALPELHFDEYERQAPDGGEDMPSLQYSDDYLRSLDGIKNKPLVREDGSGRRRAFKKRRSSGSSTSSRESRASREEELKMFTSLEEEEFENIRKGDSEYETIKYASEPNLKVGKQHRRHKRSPAKDAKRDPNDKGSLEMLDEEESNPWGEVKPENYKNTEFWKREKNLSIDEEQEEYDAKQRIQPPSTDAINIPKMSSFEEATKSQHEEAISALQRQRSKEPEPITEPDEESDTKHVSKSADARQSPAGSNSSPASASASASFTPALKSPEPKREKPIAAEDRKARTPSPTTGLRRSPRVDEMKEYAEKWKTDDRKARVDAGENPAIEIDYASDEEPMSPEHLMEGISDFYDFNASINPSRSRSRSRSKTPAVNRSVSLPERRSPSPLNCSHIPARSKSRSPSPDPASYKFIYQHIIPSLAADRDPPPDNGLSDYFDFHTKLNREALSGTTKQRSSEVHRTSVDYVLEDLRIEKLVDGGETANKIQDLRNTPSTPEYDRSISAEMRDIEKLKEEMMSGSFKRSTYVGESMDFSDQFESLREEAKLFRRSRSRSRSPVYDVEEMTARLLAKKELQEKILQDITKNSENSEDFMPDVTKNIVDRHRRSSDTALIQKPEIIFQIQDLIEETDENFNLLECEPEEYHHFRRFSLGQEIPVEQYPEDYAYVSEIEIKTLEDLKAWTADLEELPSGEILLPKLAAFKEQEENSPPDQNRRDETIEEVYESGSDDERQTVVEVDDGIDEEIWDYNERPAEESHNEQSECEEADREMDRYADRNADDWRDVEGAVGGVSDEDSFQIDQIYDEAIKNRKTSGILRDYDCILKEIQISDEDLLEEVELLEKSSISNEKFNISSEHDLLSPRSRLSRASSRDSSRSFIEYEKRDNEMRYLADPAMSAINSTRLRSRYGIVPSTSLPTGFEDDTIDVDVNYVPKKEYNWRKNFKLDDDTDKDKTENDTDSRKLSLGGESITLFSQSPEHSEENAELKRVIEVNEEEQLDEEMEQEPEEIGKPSKKKKSKRKSRKDSKGSIGVNDDEKENVLSRRSSIVAEGDLPKKKSRRESKKAVDTLVESVSQEDVPQQEDETEDSQMKKKSKKRRKVKDEIILPKLDVIIPTPEKKAPPPSVAALRAALSAPSPSTLSTELKSSPTLNKPRRLWETPSPMFGKEIPKVESNIRSSVSPQSSTTSAPNRSNIGTTKSSHQISISEAKETEKSDLLRPQSVEQTNSSPKTYEPSSLLSGTPPTEMSDSKTKVQETETADSENGVYIGISDITIQTSKSLQNSEVENNIATKIDQKQNIKAGISALPEAPTAISKPTQNPTTTSEPDQSAKSTVPHASDATENGGLYPLSTISASKSKNTPESDILKDGGLYPLF